jgi:hypothetical protein
VSDVGTWPLQARTAPLRKDTYRTASPQPKLRLRLPAHTLVYPDRPYDEHRRFLGSVARSSPAGLDGFRRHGSGVALTYFISTDLGEEHASKVALQHAVRMWPNWLPGTTTVAAVTEVERAPPTS